MTRSLLPVTRDTGLETIEPCRGSYLRQGVRPCCCGPGRHARTRSPKRPATAARSGPSPGVSRLSRSAAPLQGENLRARGTGRGASGGCTHRVAIRVIAAELDDRLVGRVGGNRKVPSNGRCGGARTGEAPPRARCCWPQRLAPARDEPAAFAAASADNPSARASMAMARAHARRTGAGGRGRRPAERNSRCWWARRCPAQVLDASPPACEFPAAKKRAARSRTRRACARVRGGGLDHQRI